MVDAVFFVDLIFKCPGDAVCRLGKVEGLHTTPPGLLHCIRALRGIQDSKIYRDGGFGFWNRCRGVLGFGAKNI